MANCVASREVSHRLRASNTTGRPSAAASVGVWKGTAQWTPHSVSTVGSACQSETLYRTAPTAAPDLAAAASMPAASTGEYSVACTVALVWLMIFSHAAS